MRINVSKLIEDKDYCKKAFDFFIRNKSLRKSDSDLFEKHLNKSLSNLEFGNFILSEHEHSIKEKLKNKSFYDWCIIIYYYALYHAVLALISKAGFESKNHLASISSLVYIYYHKKNVLEKEDVEFAICNIGLKGEEIGFISDSKDLREKASYRIDEEFNLNLAENLREKTADFINKVKNLLKK